MALVIHIVVLKTTFTMIVNVFPPNIHFFFVHPKFLFIYFSPSFFVCSVGWLVGWNFVCRSCVCVCGSCVCVCKSFIHHHHHDSVFRSSLLFRFIFFLASFFFFFGQREDIIITNTITSSFPYSINLATLTPLLLLRYQHRNVKKNECI